MPTWPPNPRPNWEQSGRFHTDWEADASLRLRHGDPTVIDLYHQHGRLVGGDHGALVDEAVGRWQAARRDGESMVITAATHATVNRIAERIRAARVAAGDVHPDGLHTVSGQTVGVGDEIVTLRKRPPPGQHRRRLGAQR